MPAVCENKGMRRAALGTAGRRAGQASLDYVLILGVVLPMVAVIMWAGPRIMRLVYEMVCVLISWPFM
jgi:hypothetical protein